MYAYAVTVEKLNEREYMVDFGELNWQAKFECERAQLTKCIRDEIQVITGNPDAAIAYEVV